MLAHPGLDHNHSLFGQLLSMLFNFVCIDVQMCVNQWFGRLIECFLCGVGIL